MKPLNDKKTRNTICFEALVGLHQRLRKRCFEKNESLKNYINRILLESLEKEGY